MSKIFTNYHSNGVNFFKQELEEVVDTVCNRPFIAEELDLSEEKEKYPSVMARKIEGYLRTTPPRGWDVDGPLNPLMTKEVMQEVLTNTFVHMKNTGQCITVSMYSQMQNEGKKFRKTDGQLSRIWGSNYINESLSNSTIFKAAKHYLVVPDNQQSLDVKVSIDPYNGCYPIVNIIQNQEVIVVSELIEGKGVALKCTSSEIATIGFMDFSGWGNIIQEDVTNIKYVVDTERKSFESIGNYFSNLKQLKNDLREIESQSTSGSRKRNWHLERIGQYLILRWEALSRSSLEDLVFTIKI